MNTKNKAARIGNWLFLLVSVVALAMGCSDSGSGSGDSLDGGEDASIVDASPDAPNGPTGTGESKAGNIGAEGGSISLSTGAVVEIPPGAVSDEQLIRITETTDPPPQGYKTYSPVYRFEPEGLVFKKPVTVKLPFQGDAKLATFFWSKDAAQKTTGWDWLGGNVAGSMVSAEVSHFSTGFIADGVNYADPPDKSCVVTRLVEGRTASPSGQALFFTVDDCWGRPITGLSCASYPNDCDFVLKENGAPLSVEAQATILPKSGVELFASLVLDLSSSTKAVLPQVIAGAKQFVTKLLIEKKLRVHIGIDLFAGGETLTGWQRPTLDANTLLEKLDDLGTWKPASPNSTNLYGAVIYGLDRLAKNEADFRRRNAGGAFTAGYLVLFTDGGDTASWATKGDALKAIAKSPDQLIAVGLQSPDYDPLTLEELAPNAVITAPSQAHLENAFGALATRMAGQLTRTYLLGYCSPKMAGSHSVSVEVKGSLNQAVGSFDFEGSGGGASCSPKVFTDACVGKECGGLGCGACDDRTSVCDRNTSQCVSFCDGPTLCEVDEWGENDCGRLSEHCGDEFFTNANGYSQKCPDRPTAKQCGSRCVDPTSDVKNCGACGVQCSEGASCMSGSCVCLSNELTMCSGRCVDFDSDKANCGGCGLGCALGESCDAGICACTYDGYEVCNGKCVNLSSDGANCGACGHGCGGGACSAGKCQPITLASGQSYPRGIAVDSGFVYWTNYDVGTVMKVGVNGGSPTILASGQNKPWAIAVDGGFVYWTNSGNDGTLMKVAVNGGSPITLATSSARDIAVDGGFVYWASYGLGTVMKVGLDGGSPTTLASGPVWATAIAVDGSFVYWASYAYDNAVMKVGVNGGSRTTLAFGQGEPMGIVVDGGFVYWTVGADILKVGVNGGSPITLASEQGGPTGIVVDGGFVYWTDMANGRVRKLDVNGGSPITLAVEQYGAEGIAVDGGFVYWTTKYNGTVMKVLE